jgi:hypothetical protein
MLVGLRAVTVQYGLDGPVLRPRTRAVKHLVNQPDGQYTGRNQPSKTVQCTAVTALDGFGRQVSILELFFSVSLMYYRSDPNELSELLQTQRMTSDVDLAPPKHSYVFCQMISPVVGHDGGPCTCYDVGK